MDTLFRGQLEQHAEREASDTLRGDSAGSAGQRYFWGFLPRGTSIQGAHELTVAVSQDPRIPLHYDHEYKP